MASELLYLGILFAITLTCGIAQGAKDQDETAKYQIDPGLVLVSEPHRIVVQRRTPLLLNCSVIITDSSLQRRSYTWRHNGEPLDLRTIKPKVQLYRNGSLYLSYVKRGRSKGRNSRRMDGVYECLVNTSKGVVLARRVEVVVAGKIRNFTKEPVSMESYIGGVARFECSVQAEPKATYLWSRDNTQLPQHDKRFTFLPSGILQISNVDINDAGLYWCRATPYLYTIQEDMITNIRWKTSQQAVLKVNPGSALRPPRLLAAPRNLSVVAGETAIFECFVDGNPMPTIAWRKRESNEVFRGEDLYKHGNLKLTQVTEKDAGTYVCRVSGGEKTLTASAVLTVLVPPKLVEGPTSYLWPVSRTNTATCSVSGNPPPTIKWYYNGQLMEKHSFISYERKNITGRFGETLNLYTLEEKHSGFYQCVAENSVGYVNTLFLLSVKRKKNAPLKPQNVSGYPVSSTAINVTWEQSPHPPVMTHVIYTNYGQTGSPLPQTLCPLKPQGSKHHCIVEKLLPYTNYSVRIMAFNSHGASPSSDIVYVMTMEDVPVGVPVLNITSPQYHSILVSWKPLSPSESRGKVVKYQIYYRLTGGSEETSQEIPGTQTSYLISGVKPETSYQILVIAATKVGFSHLSRDRSPWVTYVTPSANATSAPWFTPKYLNSTSVRLDWHSPPSSLGKRITGYSILFREVGTNSDWKKINIPVSARSYILTELVNETYYEVELHANTPHGPSNPSTLQLKLAELRLELAPTDIQAKALNATDITLSWAPVPGDKVEYEICFHKVDKPVEKCLRSKSVTTNISGFNAFETYEFNVHVLVDGSRGAVSKSVFVTTPEAVPSPPLNLTLELAKQSAVLLNWLPPKFPNGEITSYIVMYGKKKALPKDIVWKKITKTGTSTSAKVDDLKPGTYLFKMKAVTKAGGSQPSAVVSIETTCTADILCNLGTTSTGEGNEQSKTPSPAAAVSTTVILVICFSCLVGLILFFFIIFLFCRRRRRRGEEINSSHVPICPSNGHLPNDISHGHQTRPGNGHAHQISLHPDGHLEMTNFETTPMLYQIRENEQSDAKGANDVIITQNGVRLTGILKGNQRPQVHYKKNPSDLNSSDNSEELRELMGKLISSSNRNETNSCRDAGRMLSSLEDIDKGQEELEDQSSEDSGTGCRRAGMLGSGERIRQYPAASGSPGSSPGGSSSGDGGGGDCGVSGLNGSLGRRDWVGGRLVDEIGGVLIDRLSGAVIGVVSEDCVSPSESAVSARHEAGEMEESAQGRTCDESATNDRDSGHGSEAKSQGAVISCVRDSVKNNTCGSGPSCEAPPLAVSNHHPPEASVACSLPPPPPPPPLSLLTSLPTVQSSLSTTSQQLPLSYSRGTSRPHADRCHQHRHKNRATRPPLVPQADLPPPPPPPPLHPSTTLPLPQCSSAANTIATSTAASVELNPRSGSNSIKDAGQQEQQQCRDSGSISTKPSEADPEVAFSPPRPPPNPPHIA